MIKIQANTGKLISALSPTKNTKSLENGRYEKLKSGQKWYYLYYKSFLWLIIKIQAHTGKLISALSSTKNTKSLENGCYEKLKSLKRQEKNFVGEKVVLVLMIKMLGLSFW